MSMGSLTLAGLLWAAGALPADVVPMNQRNFKFPIKVAPERRAEMKELYLYVSTDQGKSWNQVSKAAPTSDEITYFAPSEGQYWFQIVVLDQRGNQDPPDVYKVPPGQKVWIDTVKPTVKMGAERQGEEILVNWDIQEEQLDPGSLRLEYRQTDMPSWSWTNVPIAGGASGQTRFRTSTPGAGVLLRMQAQDLAGNIGNAQMELSTSGTSSPQSNQGIVATPLPVPQPPPSMQVPPSAPAPFAAANNNVQQTSMITTEPRGYPDRNIPTLPATQPAPETGRPVLASSAPIPGFPPPQPLGGSVVPPSRPAGNAQLTNQSQVALDYSVSKAGPSGIGSVELYLSADDGRTWRKHAEDSDLTPPFNVELPGEGVYGLILIVKSRAGLGKAPPQPGDLPQTRLEVDTTPPAVQLYEPEPDPQRQGSLVLTWNVSDRNMAANPITLQWAERADGAWQTIGTELPNSGRHSWQLPQRIPGEVYLRLIARDAAGNSSVAQTPKPVLVDLSVPEGVINGLNVQLRR